MNIHLYKKRLNNYSGIRKTLHLSKLYLQQQDSVCCKKIIYNITRPLNKIKNKNLRPPAKFQVIGSIYQSVAFSHRGINIRVHYATNFDAQGPVF